MSQPFVSLRQIFGLLAIAFLASCSSFHLHEEKEEKKEREEKLRNSPAEQFFLQRAYPSKSLDINVYHDALESTKRSDAILHKAQRGSTPKWTVEGPNNIGARVNTIALHPSDSNIVYLGYSTGGAWKTINGGATWKPIFDTMAYLSIGHIAIDPQNANNIYIGTGDPNVTGYPFVGNGIYKSSDAGATWKHIGLTEQRIVSKIIVHPTQPNTIYVSTMGNPFERDDKRGLYKTTDGGTTWNKVLFVSSQTGITDIVMSPSNPNILYAAAWDRIRNNQESIITGVNAKIYKTINGGNSWTVVSDNGLPDGDLSRIGIAISGTNENVVFALYQTANSDLEGIYKTTNGGNSWDIFNVTAEVKANLTSSMGWYFGKIAVNPKNDNDISICGIHTWRTKDNGANWDNITEMDNDIHVDHHVVVYKNNKIYLGTDGGAYISRDNGVSFQDLEDIPTTQLYHVDLNSNKPGLIYAGAQDNGTISGNASAPNDWKRVYGGDGFRSVFVPNDTMAFYVETQRGDIWRTDDGGKYFNSAYSGIGGLDRKSWDMPYMKSRINKVLYCGTHRFYKAQMKSSMLWQPMSGDLTKGDLYGGSFNVISTIDESPKNANILYAGTSDGNVWCSMDGGANWSKIMNGLPNRYVSCIKAHPDSSNVVYVSFSGYKYNEKLSYLFRSNNNGQTWKSVSAGLPNLAINNICLVSDYELYLGTDGGVYHSQGFPNPTWQRSGDMPYVPVYDLEYDSNTKILYAATHGRSIMSIPTSELQKVDRPLTILLNKIGGGKLENASVTVQWGNYKSTQNVVNQDSISFSLTNDIYKSDTLKIKIVRDDNPKNGISTFDLVLMQKHILNNPKLDSPYKQFAADVNVSNTITTFDLVSTRRIILGADAKFALSPSWRFIDASLLFPDVTKVLEYTIPSVYQYYRPLNNNPNLKYKFIGMKMGDVNNSAN